MGLERFYASLQPGDLVYMREINYLALCRIIRVKKNESRPDYTEYVCQIVQQWFPDYEPVRLIGKRFTVARTAGPGHVYSGMWQFYSVDEFEKTHAAVREYRIKQEEMRKRRQNLRRKIVRGVIGLAILLFVLYFLFRVVTPML